MHPVKLSVIVPAYNEEKLIASTLRSIRAAVPAFTDTGWETELIVCDNNSTDRTGEVARAEGATVVFEPVNQIGRARNTGAAAATGDWLLFVDADSQPSLELFREVQETIAGGKCLAGGSTVVLDVDHALGHRLTRLWNRLSRWRRWLAGSFIFCETAAFREIGGFSQDLYASEELELSRRLKKIARRRQRQIVILDRYPLLTSGRKLHLYSRWEYVRFLAKTVFAFGGTLKDPKACQPWYDGRR